MTNSGTWHKERGAVVYMDADIVAEVKIVGCSEDKMRQERDRSSRQVQL